MWIKRDILFFFSQEIWVADLDGIEKAALIAGRHGYDHPH